MKALTSDGADRARPRKTGLRPSGSRSSGAARTTSRRSLRISSRSSVLNRSGRRPSSASTCRTYFRSVSDGNPRSAATCAIGRPDSNTSRVARSNNSTGYFLDSRHHRLLLPAGQTPYHRSLRQTRDGHPGLRLPERSCVAARRPGVRRSRRAPPKREAPHPVEAPSCGSRTASRSPAHCAWRLPVTALPVPLRSWLPGVAGCPAPRSARSCFGRRCWTGTGGSRDGDRPAAADLPRRTRAARLDLQVAGRSRSRRSRADQRPRSDPAPAQPWTIDPVSRTPLPPWICRLPFNVTSTTSHQPPCWTDGRPVCCRFEQVTFRCMVGSKCLQTGAFPRPIHHRSITGWRERRD